MHITKNPKNVICISLYIVYFYSFIHYLSIYIILYIGVRNYQIVDKTEENKNNKSANSNVHLVEIGPRFVLVPIRIFNGSLGGATLYQNSAYVSPNEERSQMKKHKG